MNSSAPTPRFFELDALRGLGALSVMFAHIVHVLPTAGAQTAGNIGPLSENTPLHVLLAGHEEVILFYILSGFVLSLPWLDGGRVAYGPYMVRRVFRIYLPYLCAALVAFACSAVIYSGPIPALDYWFNRTWSSEITVRTVRDHLLLVGSFRNAEFNPVIWSLVHEMRISFIFPFVVISLRGLDWKPCLAIAALLSGLAVVLNKIVGQGTDYLYTFHYLSFFIVGFLLSRHRQAIAHAYSSLPRGPRLALIILAILAYSGGRCMKFVVLQDWTMAAGAAAFMVLAQNDVCWQRLLRIRSLHYLGTVSYSMYLYHAIVLVALGHLFHGKLSPWIAFPLVILITVVLSALSYHFVEKPAIEAGKRLGSALSNFQTRRACSRPIPASPATEGVSS